MKWWISHLPHCYCRDCGRCTHLAEFRAPSSHYSSCAACLPCFPTVQHWFVLGRMFKFRAALANLINYWVMTKLYPKEPGTANGSAADPQAHAGGKAA
jgi:hypothetical protein